MKPQEFNILVEKFYEGNTSESEESMLKDFLEKNTAPDEYSELKEYFQSIVFSEPLLGEDFDASLMKEIENSEKPKRTITGWSIGISSIAATALIFLTLWFATDIFQPKQLYGTVTDPKVALQITNAALFKVSEKMNEGLKPADKTIKKVDKSIQDVSQIKKIDQALNDARKMQEIDKASQLLKSVSKVYVHIGNS